jgi:hypothetical protein
MAYSNSMFEPVGVAALDPKVAAYKKFVKENLGQPNLVQFLQSEQGRQIDPNLAGAMIVLEQLEKARDRSPQGPPPKTSVIQDVGMAGLQKAQEEQMTQAQQQGLARLPNPAMANAQFQGGIAAPPQQMAGGGIVAFANEGAVQSTAPPVWTQQDQIRLASLENLLNEGIVFGPYGEPVTGVGRPKELRAAQEGAREEYKALVQRRNAAEAEAKKAEFERGVAAQRERFLGPEPKPAPTATPATTAQIPPRVAGSTPPPPAPARAARPAAAPAAPAAPVEDPYLASLKAQAGMTPEQIQAERDKRYAASGMGDAVKARREEIERQAKELEGAGATDAAQRKKDLMLQLAASAFGSVGKGRTLLEGLGSTGAAFAEGAAGVQKEYRGREKERKQQSAALSNARLALQEAEAARILGDSDAAEAKRQDAMAKMYALGFNERQFKLEQEKVANEQKFRMEQLANQSAEIAARNKPVDPQGKPMTQREIGEALQALENSPQMEAFKNELAKKGKLVVGTESYNQAVDRKLRELFTQYYGGMQSGAGGGLPPNVAAGIAKYAAPR